MLVAVNGQHQLINARQAERQGHYFCPGCTGAVRLKRGSVMVAHFAHTQAADCQVFSEGESNEHLLGKQQLAAWFTASGYVVQLEAGLPGVHQRPDLLVQRGTQPPLALEFQCSPLSVQRLAERTQGYWQHGYQVLWLLGEPYHQRLRLHGKALKFLQYYQQWGAYLVFWHVRGAKLQLLHHLLTLDAEPLSYQTFWLDTHLQLVSDLQQFKARQRDSPLPAEHVHRYYRRLMVARLRHQQVFTDLQTYCYQQGGAIGKLPAWTIPKRPQLPLLTVPYIVWYSHIFCQLKRQPALITTAQLQALLWSQLRPLLARGACLRLRGQLCHQLIMSMMMQLVSQQVIIRAGQQWCLNFNQLGWVD